jgi:tetratricopeptide (TPR) repeat protein
VAATLQAVPAGARATRAQARQAVQKARAEQDRLTETSARQLHQVASGLADQDFSAEAREIGEILIKSRFATAQDYCLLATIYVTKFGDDQLSKIARGYLDKALKLDPKYGKAWALLAEIASQDGDLKQAIIYADKAIACPKPTVLAYQVKASALGNQKNYKEALINVDQAIKMAGYKPELHRNRGAILENLNRYNDAVVSYRQAIALNPTDWTYFQLVRCLQKLNKFDEAIATLNKMAEHNPRDSEIFRTRATLKVKKADVSGAIADYDKAIELEPTAKTYKDRAALHFKMGNTQLQKRDLAEAERLIQSPF